MDELHREQIGRKFKISVDPPLLSGILCPLWKSNTVIRFLHHRTTHLDSNFFPTWVTHTCSRRAFGIFSFIDYFLVERTKWKYNALTVKLHLRDCLVFVNVEKRLFKEGKLEVVVDLRREPNKASTNTKPSTRASRRPNRRGIDVEDGKRRKSRDRNHTNLRHLKGLTRENIGSDGDRKTFKGILHNTREDITHINSRSNFRFRHFISLYREIIEQSNIQLFQLQRREQESSSKLLVLQETTFCSVQAELKAKHRVLTEMPQYQPSVQFEPMPFYT